MIAHLPHVDQNDLDGKPDRWASPWSSYYVCLLNAVAHAGASLAELALLAGYADHVCDWYREPYCSSMKANPLGPGDPGHNTVTFYLDPERAGLWRYTHSTWQHGPWPFNEGMPLLDLIDHERQHDQSWETWKAEHAALVRPFAEARA